MIRQGVTVIYLILGLLLLYVCGVMQPGMYGGHFGGSFTVDADDTCGLVQIHAETARRWYWARPSNHHYSNATLRTISDKDGEANLNLLSATWQCGQDKGSVDTESLARLVASIDEAAALTPEYKTQIEALKKILDAMRDGTAPSPRHHVYSVESPTRASYQHHTSGKNYGFFALLAWAVVWPILLSIMCVHSRRVRFAPTAVYAVVLLVIVGLDLILAAVGSVTSPGPVAENVEFLLALVNLPAWAVLGDYLVLSWMGLVLGALAWATAASMIALLRRTD